MSYSHDHENEVIYFGKTNYRNQMVKFGIKADDRRRHFYIIGKTGMGKSVLLENMILSDIYAGHGCCYIDPHGDTVERVLDYIPSWRTNDVVYFNPSDVDFPIGFNILEAVNEKHKHLVTAGLMSIFKKIWENAWSSRMEYILNYSILALLDNPGSTLLGINRMLSDVEYRNRIVGNVKDPIVRQFWLSEFASYNDKYAQEAVAPIQNKIGQFLSSPVIRNIVSQVKSTINTRAIMDEQKILLINLSKGRIGEDSLRLLGGMLITRLQLSAMERVDTPETERKDFYLFVDEFQNFAVESFASILSEARKYRLCLILAHQYIAQLTDEVREAVFGNVGTMVTFRVGSPDALFLEKEYAPRFIPEDILSLPKYNIYLKLLINGVSSQPFSATTLPPIAQRTGSSERVIKVCRERYGRSREQIEENILTWSGMGNKDMATLLQEAADKKKAMKQSKKPAFNYNCSRCGTTFTIPVELDTSRPIFCQTCKEAILAERKAGAVAPQTPYVAQPTPVAFQPPQASIRRVVTPPPRPVLNTIKPSFGAVVTKPAIAPAISLSALTQHPQPVKPPAPVVPQPSKPVVSQPVVPKQPVVVTSPKPALSPLSVSQPPQPVRPMVVLQQAPPSPPPVRVTPPPIPTTPLVAAQPSGEKRKRRHQRKKKPLGAVPTQPTAPISSPPSVSGTLTPRKSVSLE